MLLPLLAFLFGSLLIAAGAFVYGVAILLLFGRGWIFALVRDRKS